MINEKILKKLSQLQQNEPTNSIYEICKIHQKFLYKICITCKIDICPLCEKEHINHYMIKQEEIMPDYEEIKKLQLGIKNYMNDTFQLIDTIKNWQKEIDERISTLENEMKNNNILNSVDFINNYNNIKLSLNSISKFRKIYSLIIEPENKNNKILSFLNEDNFITKQNNNYNINLAYNDYLSIKYLLKDINNYKFNFAKKSKKIIEYLFKNLNSNENIYNSNINKNNEKISLSKSYLYNQSTKNKNDFGFLDQKNIRILKARNIQNNINRTNIDNKLNKSYDNFNMIKSKNRTYNQKDNETIYSQITSTNGNIKDNIYSKKNYNYKNTINKNGLNYNPNIISNTLSPGAVSSDYITNNKIIQKYHSFNDIKQRKLIYNSNHPKNQTNLNEKEKMNNINSVSNMQNLNNNVLGKTYIHKKFILNKRKDFNPINNIIQSKYNKNNIIPNDSTINEPLSLSSINIYTNTDSKKNSSKNHSNNNNYSSGKNNNIIDIPISFSNKNQNSNSIRSSIFDKNIQPFNMEDKFNSEINSNNYQDNKVYCQKITKQIFYNQKNNFINKSFDINIIKPLKFEFIKINNDKKIYLGIDLGNIETKVGIIKNPNEIQLMCFSDNNYSIPTMISFDNNKIYIGQKTEEDMVNSPSQTIFNIVKIFGHEYNEIINEKNKSYLLWPFKLYRDNSNKPYIKIKSNEEEKIYYFEEILILFLKKLFDLIFKKISIENNNNTLKNLENNQISLNLIVSIPNYFSFYQRKLLEKIFLSEIFPENNSYYGGYQIILNKIGIEGKPSLAGLCLKKNPIIKNKNILIINLDSCSVDTSIISIYDNQCKVIGVDSIKLMNENFTDNFISLCLKILKQNNINIPKEFLYSESLLSKLRRLSSNIINNLAIKEDVIFTIDNLNNGNGNCIIKVNKIDYDKICFELCKKIVISIKTILIKSKLSENNINDIILIGEAIHMNKLNQMLKELFINNKNIYDKLSFYNNMKLNEGNNNYYIVAGSAIRAYSINNELPFYKFKNISPISIGIESFDGNMEFIVEKNSDLPLNNIKNIKVKNNFNNDIIINIYEGEDKECKNNKFISRFIFDKNEIKLNGDLIKQKYFDILMEFKIDNYLNIQFYINDNKTNENLIKCEINIEKREN